MACANWSVLFIIRGPMSEFFRRFQVLTRGEKMTGLRKLH
jgi:hypothetical protein